MTVDEVRELYQRIEREQPDLWKKDPQAAILADSVGRIDLLEKRFAKLLKGARQLALEVKTLREGESITEAPVPRDDVSATASAPTQQPGVAPMSAEQAALEAEMDAAIAAGPPAPGENAPRPPVGRPAPSQGKGNGRRPSAPTTAPPAPPAAAAASSTDP